MYPSAGKEYFVNTLSSHIGILIVHPGEIDAFVPSILQYLNTFGTGESFSTINIGFIALRFEISISMITQKKLAFKFYGGVYA